MWSFFFVTINYKIDNLLDFFIILIEKSVFFIINYDI